MKNIRQWIIVMTAVISLGIFIAFLLYILNSYQKAGQIQVESAIPAPVREEKIEKAEKTDNIRVLIKTKGFGEIFHEQVEVSSTDGLIIAYSDETEKAEAKERITVEASARIKPKKEEGKITLHSLERGYGTPVYEGELEVYQTEEGLVVVNELPFETYLCGVVPSEMPASYEAEALKAQAVCARCYAYNQTRKLAYPEYEAHVDDSVSYQVYNNQKRQEATDQAVAETAGELLWHEGGVAKTYFYSTSSGNSTSIEAWGSDPTEGNQYLKGVSISDGGGNAYEENLAWYRWSAVIEEGTLEKLVEEHSQQEIGELQSVQVTKRGAGNIVQQIEIRGSEEKVLVETENKIRRMLGGEGYQITKQDGTVINSMELLPSAFFTIEKRGERYIINGGGYGHGIGMSQSGANELAKAGKNYKEILAFFYPGTELKKE